MSDDLTRSKDHETDALTFLDIAREAGTAMGAAYGQGHEQQAAEASALFSLATVQADLHAKLSIAGAIRGLAAVAADLRRQLP